MKKWFITLVIVAAVPFCVFATGAAEDDASVEEIGFNATGFPVVDEPVTISVVWQKFASHVKNPSEMMVPTAGAEEMNINVEWTAVASDAWREKTNLMLASGDLPHTFAAPLSDFNIISQAEAGAFLPMKDLLDRYAPNIRATLDDRPALESFITAPDGEIYSLYKIFEGSWMPFMPILNVNKPWMEKMGLGADDMPTSLDEFFDLLMMAKQAGDLNGNGEADEIPYGWRFEAGAQGLAHFYFAHGLPIGIGYGSNKSYTMVEDGKVIYAPTTVAFRDAVIQMNRFYEAGLMDVEGFTMDWPALTAKGKQDQYFAFADWWAQNWIPGDRHDDFAYITNIPAEGYEYKTNYRTAYERGIAPITSAAEHPEVVMRWIDYWYEPIQAIQVTEGPIGVRLEQKPDGTYDVMETPEGLGLSEWRDLETIGPGAITSITDDMYQNLFIFSAAEMCGTVKNDFYGPYWPEQWWPNPVFTSTEIKEEQALLPDIQTLVSKTVATWITSGGVEEGWDEFQSQLETLGLPGLLEIWQRNLDLTLAPTGGVMERPFARGTDEPYPGGWAHEPNSRLNPATRS